MADVVSIIKGSTHQMRILVRNQDGTPYDLTGTTEVKAIFPGQTTVQTLTMTAGAVSVSSPSTNGVIEITMSTTHTNALKAAQRQKFELEIVQGSTTRLFQFAESLDVYARIS